MAPQDIVVGVVSVGLVLLLIAGAVLDGPWLMQLTRPRMLASALGRPAARLVLGLIGFALVALGIAIALGWRVHWG